MFGYLCDLGLGQFGAGHSRYEFGVGNCVVTFRQRDVVCVGVAAGPGQWDSGSRPAQYVHGCQAPQDRARTRGEALPAGTDNTTLFACVCLHVSIKQPVCLSPSWALWHNLCLSSVPPGVTMHAVQLTPANRRMRMTLTCTTSTGTTAALCPPSARNTSHRIPASMSVHLI